MGTVQLLAGLGHKIEEAATGAAALAAIDRSAELDAALVDLGLPDMRGEDLIAEMKLRRPSLGVIVTSGYGAETLSANLQPVPAVIVIGKPFSEAELRNALAKLVSLRSV